jgi:hypothetical protein
MAVAGKDTREFRLELCFEHGCARTAGDLLWVGSVVTRSLVVDCQCNPASEWDSLLQVASSDKTNTLIINTLSCIHLISFSKLPALL